VGNFVRLINNRVVTGTIIAAGMLIVASVLLIFASRSGWPERLFQFAPPAPQELPAQTHIAGSASFDKNSYLIGEIATYRIHLLWREAAVNLDLETFKNGIGFFPFTRRGMQESDHRSGGIREYILQIELQAVDVDPSQSYQLAPPTVYYTLANSTQKELQSYRIEVPVLHIGEYYPPDVSGIPLLDVRREITDPVSLRQWLMICAGGLLLVLATGLFWYFGHVRGIEKLAEHERLWRVYRGLDRPSLNSRDYLDHCERIFTGLLRYRLHVSPVVFWSGQATVAVEWQALLDKARDLFNRNYLPSEPDNDAVDQVDGLLNSMFAVLTEEQRLVREQQPSFFRRVASHSGVIPAGVVMAVFAILILWLAMRPRLWEPRDVAEYNKVAVLLDSGVAVEAVYEAAAKLPELIVDERIKASALYNFGILAARPELAGIDQLRQEALLKVMFQEEKVFIDALLHSLEMEDPFLLVAIIRDSIRFHTVGEGALKTAVRLSPADEDIRRNLELVHKRRNAYADTIEELLQTDDSMEDMGELQRQTLMDLEVLMQTEMPEKYAEFEEEKEDKDYFILEGF
jgi:hypothetical protein